MDTPNPGFWGIHLTEVLFDVLSHEPVPAGARGFRVGELAVDHESAVRLPGPHRQPSTSESPANGAAGAWVPAELGAASGEPPVNTTASGNSGYMDTPDPGFRPGAGADSRRSFGPGPRPVIWMTRRWLWCTRQPRQEWSRGEHGQERYRHQGGPLRDHSVAGTRRTGICLRRQGRPAGREDRGWAEPDPSRTHAQPDRTRSPAPTFAGSRWVTSRWPSHLRCSGRIPDFPVTRSHPPASWPSAANSSICRTYRKTAGEESRRRSPVANRWMRP